MEDKSNRKEYMKQYRIQNKERIKEQKKQYYKQNRDKFMDKSKAEYYNHKYKSNNQTFYLIQPKIFYKYYIYILYKY